MNQNPQTCNKHVLHVPVYISYMLIHFFTCDAFWCMLWYFVICCYILYELLALMDLMIKLQTYSEFETHVINTRKKYRCWCILPYVIRGCYMLLYFCWRFSYFCLFWNMLSQLVAFSRAFIDFNTFWYIFLFIFVHCGTLGPLNLSCKAILWQLGQAH